MLEELVKGECGIIAWWSDADSVMPLTLPSLGFLQSALSRKHLLRFPGGTSQAP